MKRTQRLFKKSPNFSKTIIFLLVCFVIGGILLMVSRGQFTQSLNDMGGEIPQKIRSTQETYLRKNEALLKTVAVKIKELKKQKENIISVDEMNKLFTDYGEILEVDNVKMYALIDNKFYSSDNITYKDNEYTKTEWYKKAMEAKEGEVIYTNAHGYNGTEEQVITSALRIEGTDDMLAINIFPERIKTWADIEIFPKGTYYYITDATGKIIHQDSSETTVKENEAKEYINEVYSELGIKEDEITNSSFVADNTNKESGLYKTETFNGWKIIVIIPYDDMLAGTRNILIAYYATTVLFSVMILYLTLSERVALKGKSLYTRITTVLGDSYYALYLVDFEKEQYTILKGSEYIKKSMPKTGDYQSFVEFVQNIMEEDAYKDFKETFSIENIRRLVSNDVRSFGGDFKRSFNSEFKWVNVRMLYSKEYVRKNRPEVIFAFQDADARKEKEIEEKEVLRESLETMQLATQTKNRFFSNMSHDMRTPLNAIINFSNMAKDQIDNKQRMLDYLNKINISSKQLLELINNILEVSKIEENMPIINKTEFNIRQMLEDVFSVFKEQSTLQQKNLKVVFNIKHDYVFGD